jgi:ribonuclease BN (tRNA processing enzyme)
LLKEKTTIFPLSHFHQLLLRFSRTTGILIAILALLSAGISNADTCAGNGTSLQILGSGGPIADDNRASSSYLIWHEGRARVLVDIGGGSFLCFGEAGAKITDLDLIALTHLHTDHVTDLPALLKGGYFSDRKRSLSVAGPTGNQLMPSLEQFLEATFSRGQGAYRYLAGFLDGSDGLFALHPMAIDTASKSAVVFFDSDQLKASAVGIHHGPVPTLAYRFEIAGKSIVISGDQNLSTPGFEQFAKNADILVLPMAVPEQAGRVASNLHATPSQIGSGAGRIQPQILIISHLMQRSLRALEDNLALIRRNYKGQMRLAEDLQCITIN